ncbi:MAG TPA: radical SAM protein [Thermoanaerobaculia bacterium]|nr:radical SAM protein [Thermoanaerobaculia bacterium]
MRVLLVSVATERLNMRVLPLGLGMVAAAARRDGHDVELHSVEAGAIPAEAVGEAVRRFAPDVVGFSVRNVDDQNMESPRFLLPPVAEGIAACRVHTDAPVVLGGAGYSLFPRPILGFLGADIGVRGDGEAVFPELLSRLDRGEDVSALPGVDVAGRAAGPPPGYVRDLETLPLPDASGWASADPGDPELFVPVQTRRGCPLDCSYCATAAIEGHAIRFRSPETVATHVAALAAAGFSRFYFVDNTFNLPPDYARALCRALAARRLPVAWRCIVYPYALDDALAREMAEAGCVEASLGFESGSGRILAAMNKRFRPDDVRAASEALARHGIRRHGFLLLGGPGETPETVEESLAFARSLGLESLKVTLGIRIYPGTPLAARAVTDGLVAPDDDLLAPRFYLAPALRGRDAVPPDGRGAR